MNYVIYDLEWNQARSVHRATVRNVLLSSEIIQIGAVKLDENLREIGQFNIRVTPKYYTEINVDVQHITGIRQQDLAGGEDFPSALEKLRAFCGEDYVFCTWSGSDLPVLLENMDIYAIRHDWLPPTYDLQLLFDIQITNANRCYSLTDAMEILHEPAETAHDALNDALNTAAVMRHLELREKLELCRTGTESAESTDYLLHDIFNKGYATELALLNDWSVRVFVSPITGEKAACSAWISQSHGRYTATAKDRTGCGYFISLSVSKTKAGKWKAVRWVYEDEAESV